MTCNNCRKTISSYSKFCRHWGARQQEEGVAVHQIKENIVTGIKKQRTTYDFWKWIVIIIILATILPNIYIVATVLYHHARGQCVYLSRGSTIDSCGLLSDPLYNIFAMNMMYWAAIILAIVGNYILNIFNKHQRK